MGQPFMNRTIVTGPEGKRSCYSVGFETKSILNSVSLPLDSTK